MGCRIEESLAVASRKPELNFVDNFIRERLYIHMFLNIHDFSTCIACIFVVGRSTLILPCVLIFR